MNNLKRGKRYEKKRDFAYSLNNYNSTKRYRVVSKLRYISYNRKKRLENIVIPL